MLCDKQGYNLATMTSILKIVVSCKELGQVVSFEGSCFGHALSKACQYASTDEKVSASLQPMFIKGAQASIQ